MAIRIDIKLDRQEVVVHLAGRLSGDAVTQLRNACSPIEGAFALDLSQLLFADDAGIDVIQAIDKQGAKIRGASPFIQLLVDSTFSQEADGEEG